MTSRRMGDGWGGACPSKTIAASPLPGYGRNSQPLTEVLNPIPGTHVPNRPMSASRSSVAAGRAGEAPTDNGIHAQMAARTKCIRLQ